jgi:acetoin utilization protein AcuB
MFVSNFMSAPVRTVTPATLLTEAREIMNTGSFRHLPVVDERNILRGIITDRDLRSAMPSRLMTEPEREEYRHRFAILTVGQIMTAIVTKLPDKATLDDALILFEERKVGALPVVNEANRIVGILAVNDLLKAYKQLFGLGVRGSSLLVVRDDGRPRVLTRLTELLETKAVPFTRLIRTGGPGQNSDENLIYVRVHTYNLSGIHQALAAAGFETVIPAAINLAS